MWRGIFPGATRIASNRISRIDSSGLLASQTSAAAAILRRWRTLTDSAASSRFTLALTSANTSRCRRLATISISPSGLRHRRARMRNPLAMRKAAARLSAEIPMRKAACRSGRGSRLPRRGGSSPRAIRVVFGQSERTLIDLAPWTSGCDGDFTDCVFHGHTRQRALEQRVNIVRALLFDRRCDQDHELATRFGAVCVEPRQYIKILVSHLF